MMLAFLLALLGLMSMSVDASTTGSFKATDSSAAGTSDASNASVPLYEELMIPCNFPRNRDFGDNCYCFNDDSKRFAVDRHWMTDAIDQACHLFTGGIGDPVSVYGTGPGLTPSYSYTYLYPSSASNEEGKILIALVVNKDDPACTGPLPIGWDTCWYTLHDPLDDCDGDAENGKNGGVWLHECIWWVVDPAPSTNQPYPHGITCNGCDQGRAEA